MAEYISREEAIKELREAYENEYPTASGDFDEYASHDVPNVLRNIPSADVQPVKHGKWESSQRTIETGTVYCSNCAIEYYISDLQTVGDCNGIVHYCPNCGVRMDGDTNG